MTLKDWLTTRPHLLQVKHEYVPTLLPRKLIVVDETCDIPIDLKRKLLDMRGNTNASRTRVLYLPSDNRPRSFQFSDESKVQAYQR